MTNSKLITLLKNFTPEELKELEKFADSPYHARGRNFSPLMKILKSSYPEFDVKTFAPQNIFKKLYPKENYDPKISDQKLRIFFSSMYKLCMDFLAQRRFEEDHFQKKAYLLDQLRTKKLYNDFIKLYEDSLPENESMKGSSTDLLNKHNLVTEYRNYLLEKDDYENFFRSSSLQKEYLVLAAIMYCFKYEFDKTLIKAYNVEGSYTLVDSLIENLDFEGMLNKMKQNNNRFYWHVQIYYTAYMMHKHKDNIRYFHQIKELMLEYGDIFGSMEKFILWNLIETYCASQLSNNHTNEMTRELFEVYKTMLDKGAYKPVPRESFKITLFRNIAVKAFELNEFEWLENFVKKYSEELLPRHKADMENYCQSMIEFGRKNYEDALESIMKVKYEFFLYKIDIKILMIKIFYELNSIEQVYSTADTTMQFLKNTDLISDVYKEKVKNFLKFLKVILKLKMNVDADRKNEIEYLRNEIDKEKKLNSAEWLRSKTWELV